MEKINEPNLPDSVLSVGDCEVGTVTDAVSEPAPADAPTLGNVPERELTAEEELAQLKATLREARAKQAEREEFSAYFPGVDMDTIPDKVKESARNCDLPLAAAYALYLCRRARVREEARIAAEKAAAESPGLPLGDRGERFYTIEEMQAMSREQVRDRYGALLHSLSRGIEKIY